MIGRSVVIDGGKSKTAAALIDERGTVLASATGAGLAMIGEPGGREALTNSLADTLDSLGATDSAYDTAVFGLNGVHAPSPDTDAAAAVLRSLVKADRYTVMSDGVLGYVGAIGPGPGVAVTVGTGTVILAVGRDGHAERVDGDGPLLGDRGSGYAIGLAGLREGMRVLGGLEGSVELAEQVRGEYGSTDSAVRIIHSSPTPTRLIAAFSRNVARAARDGDRAALGLWRDAATDLALGVAAAARRAGLTGAPFAVACSGGLFAAEDLLLGPLADELGRVAPDARMQPAIGGALAGGAILALSPEPVLAGICSWYGDDD